MKRIIALILILLAVIPILLACEADPIVQEINNTRISYGLNQLKQNTALNEFALYRINTYGFNPTHKNFNSDFATKVRLKKGHYFAGEISAVSNKELNINQCINAWLESPTHRDALLNNFTDMGYAMCCKDGEYIITVIFCRKD